MKGPTNSCRSDDHTDTVGLMLYPSIGSALTIAVPLVGVGSDCPVIPRPLGDDRGSGGSCTFGYAARLQGPRRAAYRTRAGTRPPRLPDVTPLTVAGLGVGSRAPDRTSRSTVRGFISHPKKEKKTKEKAKKRLTIFPRQFSANRYTCCGCLSAGTPGPTDGVPM